MSFIESEKATHSVSALCRHLNVSRSGYYAWSARSESARSIEDRRLVKEIRRIHERTRHRYGSPRMHAELLGNGEVVGRNRVVRLMRENGLRAKRKRPFRPMTTDSMHGHPLAPNLLCRDFTAKERDRVWVADITYVRTNEGWLYLAVVLDLFSRKVVGHAFSTRLDSDIAESALRRAVAARKPSPGLIHHSDRGTQYACASFWRLMERHGIRASMSRKGNCIDNAVAESFFSTLKAELVHGARFVSRRAARRAVHGFITKFYNEERRHSALRYLSPVTFERCPLAA
jgi:transposase InsO family protein